MAGIKVCGNPNMALFLQNEKLPSSPQLLESLWIPTSSNLHGSRSMVDFEKVTEGEAIDAGFFQAMDREENVDEDYDTCLNPPGKKRRLTATQVQFLERSFEVENKLEPERKLQLAKELGLQPRQVAIWFQNRRARFKNKQLERDYDSLKASFDKLKADHDKLLKENEALKQELVSIQNKLIHQDKMKEKNLEPADQEINLSNEDEPNLPLMMTLKQEDVSSAKSDVFDSDSPHYTDGNQSSLGEPADSSHVFEADHSDFSQDEDDNNLSKSILQPQWFLKMEGDSTYGHDDMAANSCSFVFDQPIWSWLY